MGKIKKKKEDEVQTYLGWVTPPSKKVNKVLNFYKHGDILDSSSSSPTSSDCNSPTERLAQRKELAYTNNKENPTRNTGTQNKRNVRTKAVNKPTLKNTCSVLSSIENAHVVQSNKTTKPIPKKELFKPPTRSKSIRNFFAATSTPNLVKQKDKRKHNKNQHLGRRGSSLGLSPVQERRADFENEHNAPSISGNPRLSYDRSSSFLVSLRLNRSQTSQAELTSDDSESVCEEVQVRPKRTKKKTTPRDKKLDKWAAEMNHNFSELDDYELCFE